MNFYKQKIAQELGLTKEERRQLTGASHNDEIYYLFGLVLLLSLSICLHVPIF